MRCATRRQYMDQYAQAIGTMLSLTKPVICGALFAQVAYAGAAGDGDAARNNATSKEAGGKDSSVEQAANSTAPLVRFRLQDGAIPESVESSGYSSKTPQAVACGADRERRMT